MHDTEDLLAAYARSMRGVGRSERTIESRVRLARGRIRAWGDPSTWTADQIVDWLATPSRSGKPLSAWSLSTYHSNTKAFLDWLVRAGKIDHSVADQIDKIRRPKSRPRPLNAAQVSAVFNLATGDVRTWLLLANLAGLRAMEIAKFRGEDIGPDYIHVVGKGRVEADIPTHPLLWDLAQSYPRQGYWFPDTKHGHIPDQRLSRRVALLFRTAGIPDGGIHRLRHTFATQLVRNGTDLRRVQTLMRHASLNTTAAYTAVDEDELRDAIGLLSA